MSGLTLRFVLSLLPCQHVLCNLDRSRDCRREAERLAGLDVDWHAKDPKLVTGPEVGVAVEIVTRLRGMPVKAAGPV